MPALARGPERKETMLYAQPRQYNVLQGQGVPDGVLVGQALAGDQRAFELLVSRYRHPLAGYIQGFLKDGEQAYDVLQHVFLKLYVSLASLSTDTSLKAWLFQVACNRCLDELRRRRRRPEVPFSILARDDREEELSPLEAIPDSELLPEEVAERTDLHRALQQAIVSLPPKFRSIVCLHCFKHLSFSEVARLLKKQKNTMKTYSYRSLPRLRKTLV